MRKLLIALAMMVAVPGWAMDQDQWFGKDRRGIIQMIHPVLYADPSWPVVVGDRRGGPIFPCGDDAYNPQYIVTTRGNSAAESEIICLSAENGSVRWSRSLRDDTYNGWNFVYGVAKGELVICAAFNPGNAIAPITALRQSDGSIAWKTAARYSMGSLDWSDYGHGQGADRPSIVWTDSYLFGYQYDSPGNNIKKIDLQTGIVVDAANVPFQDNPCTQGNILIAVDDAGIEKSLIVSCRCIEFNPGDIYWSRIEEYDIHTMDLIGKSDYWPVFDGGFQMNYSNGEIFARRAMVVIESYMKNLETDWVVDWREPGEDWDYLPALIVDVFNFESPGLRRAILHMVEPTPEERTAKYKLMDLESTLIATEGIDGNSFPHRGHVWQDRNGKFAFFEAWDQWSSVGGTWWYYTVYASRPYYFSKVYQSGLVMSTVQPYGIGAYTSPYWSSTATYINADKKIYKYLNRNLAKRGKDRNLETN